ncbi:hypothetical protein BH09CHL1_BH09CHL1_18210 [soil metagenome]
MGPGLNQLEYEVAVLRFQEIASEYQKAQPAEGSSRGIRAALSSTGRQLKKTLHTVASVF